MPLNVEEINDIIRRYGERHKAFVLGEKRDALHSILFDVPRRSIVGWEVVHEHGPWFLRELLRSASPEQIGERIKRVGGRPYYLQIAMLLCGYLATRQLRIQELGVEPGQPFPEERLEDLATICDFSMRVARTLREDGEPFPPVGGGMHQVLPPAAVAETEGLLSPPDTEFFRGTRQLAAMAGLYALLLHGEQRDGITGHGPYPGRDGATMFVLEYNDLRNHYLPWSPSGVEVPYDAIAIAYEAKDVEVRHDLFGAVVIEPLDFHERIERMAAMGRRDDSLELIGPAELQTARDALENAQTRLYETVVAWPDRMRVEYGAPLFANHLAPWVAAAGADPLLVDEVRRRAQETGRCTVDRLLEREETPNLYRELRHPQRPLLDPVVD